MERKTSSPAPRRRSYATVAAAIGALGLAGLVSADLLPSATPAYAENLSKSQPRPNIMGFGDIVEGVSPAVVSIRVKTERNPRLSSFGSFPENSPFERFFRQFEDQFGMPDRQEPEQRGRGRGYVEGQGSGFLVSADGYVVTNNHVIDNASEVVVVLNNGELLDADVVGVDDKTDLALVKINDDRDFPFVTFDKDEVRVGDWVVAVGNPFGLGGTVTAGIVSARGRDIGAGPYNDFIQIDAPINRGNSGGPTFDLDGEVVGVNTAIYSPSGGSVGIGFAIPAAIAEPIIRDLMDDGEVTRGWLGVQIQTITPDIADSLGLDHAAGALVAEPQAGSPADRAGIEEGDAILSVDGKAVEDSRGLARMISGIQPGADVTLEVFRDGKRRDIKVTLGELPNDPQQASLETDAQPGNAHDTMLGMTMAPAGEVGLDGEGLAIVEVDPTGEAAEKGLAVGDLIVSAGGAPVRSLRDLRDGVAAAGREGRKNVLLKVESAGRVRFVALPVERG